MAITLEVTAAVVVEVENVEATWCGGSVVYARRGTGMMLPMVVPTVGPIVVVP